MVRRESSSRATWVLEEEHPSGAGVCAHVLRLDAGARTVETVAEGERLEMRSHRWGWSPPSVGPWK